MIRCHDVPDSLPEFGIPFAWGRQLGFDNDAIIAAKRYFNVYGFAETTAGAMAERIARCVSSLGQAGVAFWGDPNRVVRSIGVGTGCYCSPIGFMDLGADMYLAIDDTVRNWIETTYSTDSGLPLAVVNHGTSEEPGVIELSRFLAKELAPIEVVHIPQGCSYRWITGAI